MLSVQTRFGFPVQVDECTLRSYEFVDLVAQISDEDEPDDAILAAQRRLHLLLLGKTQRRELVKFLKEKFGEATAEMMNEVIADVFQAIGQNSEAKKSLSSPE